MKILKRGLSARTQAWRVECPYCKAELEYTQDDVRRYPNGYSDPDGIVCADCQMLILRPKGEPVQ